MLRDFETLWQIVVFYLYLQNKIRDKELWKL